jgi:hypothetical protein
MAGTSAVCAFPGQLADPALDGISRTAFDDKAGAIAELPL